MGEFVHLHLHSEYSLLDGACRIEQIPQRAADCGHDAVAITDHGVMYGVIPFYLACKRVGIKPIIGCEVYVAPGSRFEKKGASSGSHAYSHLVLLCENMEGYRNLMALVSAGFTDGFYGKPRVDKELLKKHHTGLIALSACLAGDVPQRLIAGDMSGAVAAAKEYADIFGYDHFYIELQQHGLEEERQILPSLVQVAKTCGLPMVATNDCHYLRRQDADVQKVLTCIQTNHTLEEGSGMGFSTDEFYYKDTSEMRMLFGAYEGAMENTVAIAARCSVEFDFDTTYLPRFDCPNGQSSEAFLRALTETGFDKRKESRRIVFDGEKHTEQIYRERLEYELSVISQMGYDDYFLIVQDYVGYAKEHDIPVGPGRGSGAGSLVAYCLGITDVNPIEFDLLFERFLNPERVSMPDIDVDFCYNRRDDVVDYVTERYGRDRVSQIITFGTLAARAAIRDVGRTMGMSYSDVDVVARAVPQELGMTIQKALAQHDLKELYEGSEEVQKLVDTAMAIEGMPRNVSIHAAGVVITDRAVSEYVPLAVCNGTVVTQYDMDTVAKLGLLKFDFLALRYLTIMHDAEMQVREADARFRLEEIPLDDADTYTLISKGNTMGVFQLESAGMRQMLTNLKPVNIGDIEAAIALYRPGPMEAIPTYIANRQDPSRITYVTPLLKPILESTFGVTVYQEQVMSIFRTLAGYTFGHADIVRRAMSKKKADVLEAEREEFVAGAGKNGISADVANQLFDDMGAFANYAFNKSHAAAYAMISYRTAYLKTHYAGAYFSALLTSVLGNQTKMAEYVTEAGKAGISVLPPDINESTEYFHSEYTENGETIRYGLLALKNVGQSFLEAILRERKKRKFDSFEDFLERMSDTELNKRQVEALIKSGAFDSFSTRRAQLMAVYETMIDTLSAKTRSNLAGQLDMFAAITDDAALAPPVFEYPDIPEYSLREKLMLEKDASGMFFSGQLLDEYSGHVASLQVRPICELLPEEGDSMGDVSVYDKERVKIAGVVTSVTLKTTRNDDKMAFFTVQDSLGSIECIAFPKAYDRYREYIRADEALYVEGNCSVRDEEPVKILVSAIACLIENGRFEKEKQKQASAASTASNTPPQTPLPRAAMPAYNPYGGGGTTALSASPATEPVAQSRSPKLYLRVPDMTGIAYQKAKNLVDIFCDGQVQVVFYDMSVGKYAAYSVKSTVTPLILQEWERILGKDNVVYRP